MFRSNRKLRTPAWIGVALLLAAALSGCADSAAEEDSGPIKIGASISKTGNYSESAAYYLQGIELWVKAVNADGGIDGRRVELVTYDDKSSADEARLLAERLVTRDEVDLLIGPYSAPVTASVALVAEREKVPMIASLAGDNAIWVERATKWSFHAYVPGFNEMEGVFDLLEKNGAKSMTVINEESSNFITTAEWMKKEGARRGFSIKTHSFAAGTLDFNPIVDRLSADKPEALVLLTYAPEATEITQSLIERKLNIGLISGTTLGDAGYTKAIKKLEGVVYRTPWRPDRDTTGNAEFVKSFEAEYDGSPSYHAAAGYAGGQVAEAALKEAGTDPAALQKVLASNEIETVLGTYKVNERGWQVGYGNLLVQYQGSGQKVVWTPEEKVGPGFQWPKAAW